jgi:hypothetical protein
MFWKCCRKAESCSEIAFIKSSGCLTSGSEEDGEGDDGFIGPIQSLFSVAFQASARGGKEENGEEVCSSFSLSALLPAAARGNEEEDDEEDDGLIETTLSSFPSSIPALALGGKEEDDEEDDGLIEPIPFPFPALLPAADREEEGFASRRMRSKRFQKMICKYGGKRLNGLIAWNNGSPSTEN